jgi:hypothetical protein
LPRRLKTLHQTEIKVPEVVVDTVVIQSSNASLIQTPHAGRKITRRLELLRQIRDGEVTLLYSKRLVREYLERVPAPRNEYVRAFFEIITTGRRAVANWHTPWMGDRQKARDCRYPAHDDHVLRTAIRLDPTTIFTEEAAMLGAGTCIYREFRVRIQDV